MSFAQTVVDCENAAGLADFWSRLLDRSTEPGANQFCARILASADRSFPALMFLQVPEPRGGKNRWHLDFFAPDPAPRSPALDLL